MSMNMKRTILSLLVAGLCAGIGTSAIAEDAAAQTAANEQAAAPGTDSNSQQPAKSAEQINAAKGDVTGQKPSMNATVDAKPIKEIKEMESDSAAQPKKTKDY